MRQKHQSTDTLVYQVDSPHPLHALNLLIYWRESVLNLRGQVSSSESGPGPILNQLPILEIDRQFVMAGIAGQYQISLIDWTILAFALAIEFKPSMISEFHQINSEVVSLGLVECTLPGQKIPSVETIIFVLAGESLEDAIQVRACFSPTPPSSAKTSSASLRRPPAAPSPPPPSPSPPTATPTRT